MVPTQGNMVSTQANLVSTQGNVFSLLFTSLKRGFTSLKRRVYLSRHPTSSAHGQKVHEIDFLEFVKLKLSKQEKHVHLNDFQTETHVQNQQK